MRGEDSRTIVIPEAPILLAAIEDIAFRYKIGDRSEQEFRDAMNSIHGIIGITMTQLGTAREDREELRKRWDAIRVDQGTARAFQDPALRRLSRSIDGLIVSIKEITPKPESETEFHINYEFFCEECGGYLMEVPDNPSDDDIARCTACGHQFGRYADVRELCLWKGHQELRRMKLGAYAS